MMLDIHALYDKFVEGQEVPILRRLEMAGTNTDSLGIPHETLNSVDVTGFGNNLITLTKIQMNHCSTRPWKPC